MDICEYCGREQPDNDRTTCWRCGAPRGGFIGYYYGKPIYAPVDHDGTYASEIKEIEVAARDMAYALGVGVQPILEDAIENFQTYLDVAKAKSRGLRLEF